MHRRDAALGAGGWTAPSGDGTDPGSATTAPQTSSTDPTVSAAPTALQHSFRFRLPTGLPAGSYVAEATGVVGTGDGCPTSTPGDDEEVATATAAVTVP